MRRAALALAVLAALNAGILDAKILREDAPPEQAFLGPEGAGAFGIAKYANDAGGHLEGNPRMLWIRDGGGGHFYAKYLVTPQGLGPSTFIVTMIRSEWQVIDVQSSGSP